MFFAPYLCAKILRLKKKNSLKGGAKIAPPPKYCALAALTQDNICPDLIHANPCHLPDQSLLFLNRKKPLPLCSGAGVNF